MSSAPAGPTVADLGERAVIARIAAALPAAPATVTVGIGDDAAVVEPERGALTAVTTDTVVDGVHFDLRFTPPGAVGHRALAASLSDLAAMGAVPRHALLSLGLPGAFPAAALDELVRGVAALAERHATAVVGGNVTRSNGPLFVEVTALGSVRRRRVLRRSAARPGDGLYLSGAIGGAAAGLEMLQGAAGAAGPDAAGDEALAACRERYLRPEPRVRLGRLLGPYAHGARVRRPERRPGGRGRPARGSQRCRRGRGRRGRADRAGRPALVRGAGARPARLPAWRARTTSCCSRCRPAPGAGWRPSAAWPGAWRSPASASSPASAASCCGAPARTPRWLAATSTSALRTPEAPVRPRSPWQKPRCIRPAMHPA